MTEVQIAFGWNAFQSCSSKSCNAVSIEEGGVMDWIDPNIIISIFFYVATSGVYDLSVVSESIMRQAELMIGIPSLNRFFISKFNPQTLNVKIGTIEIITPGYIKVDFKGSCSFLNRRSGHYPALKYLILNKVKDPNQLTFVQESFSSHFGRRGPSVHLFYGVDYSNQIMLFSNQVTVPKNNDIIGTYAMAIGFDGGYFGMQVNSATERRILFSVWSPQDTNDPNQVDPENAVILDKKGTNTVAQEFGGEGSGGQSYIIYPWVTDIAYEFKLEGKPIENGYSLYSAYFKDPTKQGDDILIASWKRPKTQNYLTGIYSFLENFSPENGHKTRKVYYNNQKAYDSNGKVVNVTSASFSYDNTADSKQRLDYDGGVEGQKGYYLRNCGFFNKTNVQFGDLFQNQKN